MYNLHIRKLFKLIVQWILTVGLSMKSMPQSRYRIFSSYSKVLPRSLQSLYTMAIISQLSVTTDKFALIRIVYKGNYIVCTLYVWLHYFEMDCSMIQYFILCLINNIPLYESTIFFFLLILQLINLTYYQIFAIMNKGTMDILVESQIFWDLPGTRWIMLKVILYQLGLEMTFT